MTEIPQMHDLHAHRGVTDAEPPALVVQLRGDAPSLCTIARRLLAEGADPRSRLEGWRGGTLAISGPLGLFARLTVEDGSNGSPRYRVHRPVRVGSTDQQRTNGRERHLRLQTRRASPGDAL
jgi:hypothetical protein